MFGEHFSNCDNILLASACQSLILFDENFDKFVERVDFLYTDDGHVFDEHGEFLLLCEKSGVLEVGHQTIGVVFFLVFGYLEPVALFLEHFLKSI
jgi:hypothetical protein